MAANKVTDIDRQIGESIGKHRLANGWTQQELAAELGCSYQQVQKYEWARTG